jgi:hypothetical protein
MSILADLDAALAAPVAQVKIDPLADLEALFGLAPVPRAPRAVVAEGRLPVARAAVAPLVAEPVEERPLSQAEMRRQLDARAAADSERLAWPARWWDGFDAGDAAACQALWATVLREGLRDAARSVANLPNLFGNKLILSADWVGSRDFYMVATMAGFDGVAFADRLRPVLADPELSAAFDARLMAAEQRGKAGAA